MSKPVDFSQLGEGVQRIVRDNFPEAVAAAEAETPENTQRQKSSRRSPGKSAAAAKRTQTGKEFEGELANTHAAYEFRKWGRIRRNHMPTRVERHDARGAVRRAIGPADVDFVGWVSAAYQVRHDLEVFLEPMPQSEENGAVIIPAAFDAKVLSEHTREGWYQHDEKLQHQLHGLKAAAEVGEVAFLFVLVRAVDRAFGIPILPHFHALLSGQGVQMFYRLGAEVRAIVPSVTRDPLFGWHWLPMLEPLARAK